ncbi:hypothetical protein J2W88_003921 [Acidovorax delafieldii]|uniref:Uncharacterized protein n=1 Tax=Acidovorax delafieldii TaxID=47920 RepID=A0AAJ2F2P9_ACIDE|nr:hypothetical protein [Acidovorax delafieldii]MDR6768617.1 hypothetical protein [Acidovorax delafieldii]MDR6837332.1 hypothetical protein [Acidovorax delafieldii]MDR7366823.1 hypothetical protein [Acidovorax delafieldii]
MGLETVTYISDLNPLWPLGTLPDRKSEGDNHLRNIKSSLLNTFSAITGAVTATHVEINYLSGVTSNVQVQLNAKAPTASPTFTGTVVLPAATSIGTVTAAEILALSGVSSAIQTQLNGKGAIAGQTWTGAHNFTGATVTVPTATAGDATNNAASTAFVASTAFAAALPGQTGNAGKFVYTDGSAASWRFPYLKPVSVTGTSQTAVAGNAYRLQNVAATTLTLPASPSDGDVVGVYAVNLLQTNVIARNGQSICGLAEDMTIDTPYFPIVLEFRTGYGWGFVA